ncbi:receptor kinase At4g00960 isoform X2 [Olea europaea subsp. europaea]|uniref:Receptor kinase At4g00960 isoform X2 n=1 Tax=Olea europaea subsp. europaea TaxID=158383 RepID=A0A8S0UNQ1_OLEEU|nr:receptor kinase At4g00960 isoform X2 [Olea europaea subsp. europaea]
MSSQIWLAFIFLNLTNFLAMVKSQTYWCLNNGNYTSNDMYEKNLDTLLSSLSSLIDGNGFYSASNGENSDRVNAMALCRGDVQLDKCRSCINNSMEALLQSCPYQKQAMFWAENGDCMVRYSNESIFGKLATDPFNTWTSGLEFPSPKEFYRDLRALLDNLRSQAAYGGALKKFAAANATAPDFLTLYGLLQCTPDLSSADCSDCLIQAYKIITQCCNGNQGFIVLCPSCILRYETYLFYNDTSLPAPLHPAPTHPAPPAHNEISTVESLYYDFDIISAATNNFSDVNMLGRGGFGIVYKGKLVSGQEIAVKRLSMNSRQGDLEFKNEVLLVASLQHRNLVRLLGFSLKGSERLLIYEFVENGSLDCFLFDPSKCPNLDWDRRYKIIKGIAKGVLYLHEDSRLKIIHRDLKSGNILLDGDINPKISDFGMARLFVQDQTHGSTSRIVGT